MNTENANATQTSSASLRRAADLLDQMASLQAEYNALVSGKLAAPSEPTIVTKGKRHFTPESLARITAGQRKRRANERKAKREEAAKAAATTAPATPEVPAPAAPVAVAA